MRKLIALMLCAVMLMSILVSCSNTSNSGDGQTTSADDKTSDNSKAPETTMGIPSPFISATPAEGDFSKAYVSGGTHIYYNGKIIQNISVLACRTLGEEGNYPLCFKSGCDHGAQDCPSNKILVGDINNVIPMVVDVGIDGENAPIYCITLSKKSSTYTKKYTLSRYDALSGELYELCELGETIPQAIILYGDWIYLSLSEKTNKTQAIYRVSKQGGSLTCLSDEKSYATIINIVNDNLFYKDKSGKIFVCSLDAALSEMGCVGTRFGADQEITTLVSDGYSIIGINEDCEVYAFDASDLQNAVKVTTLTYCKDTDERCISLSDNKLYYLKCGTKFKLGEFVEENGTSVVNDYKIKCIGIFDLETGELSEISINIDGILPYELLFVNNGQLLAMGSLPKHMMEKENSNGCILFSMNVETGGVCRYYDYFQDYSKVNP